LYTLSASAPQSGPVYVPSVATPVPLHEALTAG
jgi:hypothetical protein